MKKQLTRSQELFNPELWEHCRGLIYHAEEEVQEAWREVSIPFIEIISRLSPRSDILRDDCTYTLTWSGNAPSIKRCGPGKKTLCRNIPFRLLSVRGNALAKAIDAVEDPSFVTKLQRLLATEFLYCKYAALQEAVKDFEQVWGVLSLGNLPGVPTYFEERLSLKK